MYPSRQVNHSNLKKLDTTLRDEYPTVLLIQKKNRCVARWNLPRGAHSHIRIDSFAIRVLYYDPDSGAVLRHARGHLRGGAAHDGHRHGYVFAMRTLNDLDLAIPRLDQGHIAILPLAAASLGRQWPIRLRHWGSRAGTRAAAAQRVAARPDRRGLPRGLSLKIGVAS
ncbi:hypothetical protein BJV78DRAFT_1158023 [Lactifluus subvellereus]|nr:hypothetical protein BJV78DRAFT_1158023 [Lactifluus subvellereus]